MQIEFYSTVTSTAAVLRELAADGAPEGTVVVAYEQTAGKGQYGRTFHSPPDVGVYFSTLFTPDVTHDTALFTAAAAVAVCRAIEQVCLPLDSTLLSGCGTVQIKWVNDVFVRGKKAAGILTESVFSGSKRQIHLGIGINVYPCALPPDIAATAGSIFAVKPSADVRQELVTAVVTEMFALYRALPLTAFMDEYRDRSCVLGRTIILDDERGNRTVTAAAIDDAARLLVREPDGSITTLTSGRCKIRPA